MGTGKWSRFFAAALFVFLSGCATTPEPQWVDTSVGRALKLWAPIPPTTTRRDAVYPEALRTERIEGSANLDVVVDEQGTVLAVERVEATHREFASAALAAISGWHFRPHLDAGQPVKAVYLISFSFRLD